MALENFMNTIRVLLLIALSAWPMSMRATGQGSRQFTVSDDIGIVQFGCQYAGDTQAVTVSPNRQLVAIHTERGSLKENRLEDELRIYDAGQIRRFMENSGENVAPAPIWDIHEATNRDGNNGCLISRIRWLSTSDGVAFLLRNESGHSQLFLADLSNRKEIPLSPVDRNVTGFEILDRTHYVFTIADAGRSEAARRADPVTVVVEPNQLVTDVLFPDEEKTNGDRSELWAALGGSAAPVVNAKTGKSIVLYWEGSNTLALSPDGNTVIAALPVVDIPADWEARFPPPYPAYATPIKRGHQDLGAPYGIFDVSQYTQITLKDGATTPLLDAPTAFRAGWWANFAAPAWSDDGKFVVLPGAFPSDQAGPSARPCVAIKNLSVGSLECVVPLKRNLASGFEPGYERMLSVTFPPKANNEIVVGYVAIDPNSIFSRMKFKTYIRVAPGTWRSASDSERDTSSSNPIIEVKTSLTLAPQLVATDAKTGRSRVLWDPNPQLKNLEFGDPGLYRWKDNTGQSWSAILYKPKNLEQGKRYPLVIETHGYNEKVFQPSGGFPSAFAAQELASAGIVVLHMKDCPGRGSSLEGPCNVRGYESGVDQLVRDGLVDPNRVGITGFSRTVFYIMEALTMSKLHFAAASITDGMNLGYFQHILDAGPTKWADDDASMIGARPFGPGLQQWMEHSPEFQMDKVTTPLRIVANKTGPSILYMWEPYALLHEMNQPAEFVILDNSEHVVTNPAVRLAAQGGNVDWYRFWLQGYEDPDSSKAAQYRRWEAMRDKPQAALSKK
jgi:hypothetical protein